MATSSITKEYHVVDMEAFNQLEKEIDAMHAERNKQNGTRHTDALKDGKRMLDAFVKRAETIHTDEREAMR